MEFFFFVNSFFQIINSISILFKFSNPILFFSKINIEFCSIKNRLIFQKKNMFKSFKL